MIVREDRIKFYEDEDRTTITEVVHVLQDNIKIIVDKLDKIQEEISILKEEKK